MNEPSREPLMESTPAEPRKAGLFAPLAKILLGPNEDLVLKPFTPFLPSFNLAPAPKPPSVTMLVAFSVALASVVVTAAYLAFSFQIQAVEAEIRATEELAARRKQEQQRYSAVQRMVDLVTAQKVALDTVAHGAPRWSTILDQLRSLTPSELRYEKVKGDASGQVYIQGHAEDLEALGKFMVNLRGSGTFYKPSLGMGKREEMLGKKVVEYDLRTGVITKDWLVSPEFQATTSAPVRKKR